MKAAKRGRADGGLTVELVIECGNEEVAAELNDVLMPDNRYFPKDQKFEASKEGRFVRFNVKSPRVRPALTTVASIVSDARLFNDLWVEARTEALGSGPRRLASRPL